MKLPPTGGCQRGKCRYEVTTTPMVVCTCHCTIYQCLTGSAFSMAVLAADEAFHLTAGGLRRSRAGRQRPHRDAGGLPRLRLVDLQCGPAGRAAGAGRVRLSPRNTDRVREGPVRRLEIGRASALLPSRRGVMARRPDQFFGHTR